MTKAIVIAAALVLLVATACKKKSNDDDTSSTVQILSNTWLYDTAGFDIDKDGAVDQPIGTLEQECDVDNSFTFKSDGSGIFDDGEAKCNTADPQTTPFTWSLKNGDSTMVIAGDIMEELKGDAEIVELNSTTLRLAKAVEVNSFTANLIITLKR